MKVLVFELLRATGARLTVPYSVASLKILCVFLYNRDTKKNVCYAHGNETKLVSKPFLSAGTGSALSKVSISMARERRGGRALLFALQKCWRKASRRGDTAYIAVFMCTTIQRAEEREGGACSFVACLSHLAIDHASLSRRSIERGREGCLLYTSPSPRDKRQSRMPSSA